MIYTDPVELFRIEVSVPGVKETYLWHNERPDHRSDHLSYYFEDHAFDMYNRINMILDDKSKYILTKNLKVHPDIQKLIALTMYDIQ
jgi:hypothetical protein